MDAWKPEQLRAMESDALHESGKWKKIDSAHVMRTQFVVLMFGSNW
jgi:hypothetical protein